MLPGDVHTPKLLKREKRRKKKKGKEGSRGPVSLFWANVIHLFNASDFLKGRSRLFFVLQKHPTDEVAGLQEPPNQNLDQKYFFWSP